MEHFLADDQFKHLSPHDIYIKKRRLRCFKRYQSRQFILAEGDDVVK